MLRPVALAGIIGVLVVLAAPAGEARRAVSTTVTISEVYGGGGNSGAPYANDFIEIRNVSASDVSLAGWSVQYASATGAAWAVTPLPSVTLPARRYFLVQEASGGVNGSALPTPDATGTIALAAASGKVAVVASATPLSGTCPTGAVDLVGYGTATCFEGSGPAPAASNTLSDQRRGLGATDTDDNAADFEALAPEPQNTQTVPSAVTVRAFTASRVGAAVLLRWRTASEAASLGFDVYRGATRVNRALVRARGGAKGATYAVRDLHAPARALYRLRETRLDGSHAWVASARAGAAFTRPG